MQQGVKDVSLSDIYSAMRDPKDPSNADCLTQIAAEDTQCLDKILRRLLAYAQSPSERWPLHRLLRCLIFIFNHGPRAHLLPLRSFREAVQLAIRHLRLATEVHDSEPPDATGQAAAKFLCHLMEYLAKAQSGTSFAVDAFLQHMRRHGGIEPILQGTLSKQPAIRRSCFCALIAKGSAFAQNLIDHEVFIILSKTIGELSDMLRNPDDSLQGRTLEPYTMACRVWEILAKLTRPSQLEEYARSVNFVIVHQAWTLACIRYLEDPGLTKLARIVYSLTWITDKCASVSKVAASRIVAPEWRERWLAVLALELRQIMILQTDAKRDKSVSHAMRLSQMALNVIDEIPKDTYRHHFIHQIIYDTTNFITLFLSQISKPEDIARIGDAALLPIDICVDTEVFDSMVEGEKVEENAGLLNSLLECFIRYVQAAHSELVETVSRRAAWCIKQLLSTLREAGILEKSKLSARLRRLVVFFLHYEAAIVELATNTSGIREYLWEPTIANAREGLLAAAAGVPDPDTMMTTIKKARRAFVSLEMITRQPRAFERIIAENVFELIDTAFIPSDTIFNASEALQTMYALFARFVAALAGRMALVRIKLREGYPVIPVTLNLLIKAIHGIAKQKDSCKHVMIGCLQVISAFKSDEITLKQWLAWKSVDDEDLEHLLSTLTWMDGVQFPLLSALLTVLLPWNPLTKLESDGFLTVWQQKAETITSAAAVFEQLSSIPEFGRQLIPFKAAIKHICELVLCLSDIVNENNGEGTQAEDTTIEEDAAEDDSECQENQTLDIKEANICYLRLYRGLSHLFDGRENLETLVLHDTVTTLFEPLLALVKSDKTRWWLQKFRALLSPHTNSFVNLFESTRSDDKIKLHELSAVAICHVCPTSDWETVLGIGLDSSTSVFAVLCRMLVYGLEESATTANATHVATLYRQKAAAQAIELMSLDLETEWHIERDSRLSAVEKRRLLWTFYELADDTETFPVVFLADDSSEPVYVSVRVLRQHSAVFRAMLSEKYAESVKAPIKLHEVAASSLQQLFEVATEMSQQGVHYKLPASMAWDHVVDLLKVADRFCCESVAMLCQEWVLETVNVIPVQNACLEGCLQIFQRCRDTSSYNGGLCSTDAPFHTVLHECIKTLTVHLSLVQATPAFACMTRDDRPGELDSFCCAIAVLLQGL